ncbi:Uncharacterized conserved protein YloU, alkaline shock protein (Asp23) family [Amycolatopsis marina]|uniref:Uncharacterized conserved protein YloU, alkaline shock protein (Asp23) family n=1 Tax=Amycolatopsis marina TaxID=490629 RepID=A0A1I0VL59_9PSEU|nr:Asp23/Gls24 family envelope stress response protein [Amycolatopsis marina]SFA77144.1 Uncharacterized conserved protein YloU, alkaline shock protein (Asp23) family [Amycolatopsis marina]
MSPDAVTEFVIDDVVIAGVAARAAAGTPGVVRLEPGLTGLVVAWSRAARGRWKGITPAPAEGVTVQSSGDELSVRVDIVVSGADQAAAVGQAVQRGVARAIAEDVGLRVAGVSVSILDIEPELM